MTHEPKATRGGNRYRENGNLRTGHPGSCRIGQPGQCALQRRMQADQKTKRQDTQGYEAQVVQKPKVRANEQTAREIAKSGEASNERDRDVGVTPHARGAQDPRGDDQRPQEKPADDERNANPDESRHQKRMGALAVKRHVAEEARNEKEQRHTKRVADERKHGDGRTCGHVRHGPADVDRHERQARVKDNAKDERERTYRVQVVQPVVL